MLHTTLNSSTIMQRVLADYRNKTIQRQPYLSSLTFCDWASFLQRRKQVSHLSFLQLISLCSSSEQKKQHRTTFAFSQMQRQPYLFSLDSCDWMSFLRLISLCSNAIHYILTSKQKKKETTQDSLTFPSQMMRSSSKIKTK